MKRFPKWGAEPSLLSLFFSLGLAWIGFIIFMNIIFAPPEEDFKDKTNNWIKVILVWLLVSFNIGLTMIISLTCGLA